MSFGGDAHLNLIESSRQLFELDPGAEIEAGDGWQFGAGSSSHPTISNAAFRSDDDLDAGEFLRRAGEFFGARGRGFAVWARVDVEEDRGLVAAAEADGMKNVYELPEMVLKRPPEEQPLPAGVELSRVASADDARAYWDVAQRSYASLGFPPEVFAFYENHDGLRTDDVVAFLAHVDGRPAGIAMTIVNHGIAGIYWVGTVDEARGKGLGTVLTAAAVTAGFGLGAEVASLQASPMGEGLYRRMGFEKVFDYCLLAR